MISKCANPECPKPFRYLREGQVFRVEVQGALPASLESFVEKSRKPVRRVEHFWLCGECSRTMNFSFDEDSRIHVVAKERPLFRRSASAG